MKWLDRLSDDDFLLLSECMFGFFLFFLWITLVVVVCVLATYGLSTIAIPLSFGAGYLVRYMNQFSHELQAKLRERCNTDS